MASSSKRLQNDVLNYESSSDHKIASSMYYIIFIRLGKNVDCSGLLKTLIRQKYDGDGYPLAGYTYSNEIYLIFSSLEDSKEEHYLSGSHQKLCSYFASSISRSKDTDVECSVIEIDSRTKILIYFQTKIYENAKKTISSLLKGKIEKKDVAILSMFELLELLKKNSVDWNSIQSIKRYGTFYKYIEDGAKAKISTLSELIDIRDFDKYTKYLFK
jgi:hypothetical protein